jgi:hypothetical protein
LIVQQMDFESGPNQTGEPRPEDKSLIADDGSGKTELEKEKDKKLIESDENAVQELIGSISRPKTPADISQPNTARDRT